MNLNLKKSPVASSWLNITMKLLCINIIVSITLHKNLIFFTPVLLGRIFLIIS
jgi:hypothetical protein